MSNSAVAVPVPTPREAAHGAGQQDSNQGTRTVRNDRSTGKGRRRRAAAEQRRIEQQRWGQYLHDSDEEIFVAPRSGNRRRARRSSRQLVQDELDDFSPYGSSNDDGLDVALAISLSLSETSQNSRVQSSTGQEVLDMSYENLVQLENVKCVASSYLVSSLLGFIFEGSTQNCSPGHTQELCAICQNEYEGGDHLMLLPCTHNFHHACGSEWLLQYSKLCPVCKHDITEEV